ncbi:hypothetical protein [Methylovulum psychrotolerans]|uniref:HEPN domain-containing protein n=1 Tax=Methylovulum psychrotolerans TaxID=1704499 RepID=A0A2S5CI42_9GAMM|nr:hypothetical protein [Methylovulum psychrotolerans]POZ50478.1 hypothetical protein AADEFJLK_03673 [Methylovulum psychrotolerans]
MKVVGEQLEKWAHNQAEPHIKNLFGRSAFNRYYYAAFLITREMLGDFEPKWKYTPHSDIPGLLENALRKPILNRLKHAVRFEIISFTEEQRLRQELQIATSELSSLLKSAYNVRIIADYQPETAMKIDGKVISLDDCNLNSASSWADRARAHCKIIRRVRKEAGLD